MPAQILSLPEMLQRLVNDSATGLLKVEGSGGWKILEVRTGKLTLVTSQGGHRLRLGELLLAHGKIDREDLAHALEVQKRTGVRLGEALVQSGKVTTSVIADIVRFQLEEEVYDLFTWKGVKCAFDQGATAGDRAADYPESISLLVDPKRVLKEAAGRIPIWQRIERLILSSKMVFMLTEQGVAMLQTSSRSGRRLLELVDEGHSVENIARKAMVGCFPVWRSLADLLEAGIITEVAPADLPAYAAGLEERGALEPAIDCYERLVEVTGDPIKSGEYRARIHELQDRLRALEEAAHPKPGQKAAGATPGLRAALGIILALAVIVGAGVFMMRQLSGDGRSEDLGPYYAAQAQANKLADEGKIGEARQVWDVFLARHQRGTAHELARSAREVLDMRYEGLVEDEIAAAQALIQETRFAEAIQAYEDILRRYPLTSKRTRIAALKVRAENDWAEHAQRLTRQELANTLKRGRELFEGRRYEEALSSVQTALASQALAPEARREAEALLQELLEVRASAERVIAQAKQREDARRLDDAVALYEEAVEIWGPSGVGSAAADRAAALTQERARAQRLYSGALASYAEGDFTDAVGSLRRVMRFEGWAIAKLAEEKLADIAASAERSEQLLAHARRLQAEGRMQNAFDAMAQLVERYPHTIAARQAEFPVEFRSTPSGAEVFLNGRRVGLTPVTVSLPPTKPGRVLLKRRGFIDATHDFDRLSGPLQEFFLKREVLFRRSVAQAVQASPVLAGERFAVRSRNALTLFLARTGAPLWQVRLGEHPNPQASASFFENAFFVSGSEPRVVQIAMDSGQEIASHALPAAPSTTPFAVRLGLLANRMFVVVGCENGEVVSIDSVSGSPRWTARLNAPARFDPAVATSVAAFASPGGNLTGFDMISGSRRWSHLLPGEVSGHLALDRAGERIGAVTNTGEVHVYAAASGARLARIITDGLRGGGLLIEGDRVFIAGDDGRARAFGLPGGESRWTVDVGSAMTGAPVLTSGMLFVGTADGRVVCIDPEAGRLLWQVKTEAAVAGSGVASQGMAIFADAEGNIYGIDASQVD